MLQKFKRITSTKLRQQGGKTSGRDGIIQIAKTLFSLWSLVKEMHTETRAQNIKAGGVVTYYNYLGKATLKFGTGPVRENPKLIPSWIYHYNLKSWKYC